MMDAYHSNYQIGKTKSFFLKKEFSFYNCGQTLKKLT